MRQGLSSDKTKLLFIFGCILKWSELRKLRCCFTLGPCFIFGETSNVHLQEKKWTWTFLPFYVSTKLAFAKRDFWPLPSFFFQENPSFLNAGKKSFLKHWCRSDPAMYTQLRLYSPIARGPAFLNRYIRISL